VQEAQQQECWSRGSVNQAHPAVGCQRQRELGAGNIDFDRVFRGLVKAGYEGPITFESFSSAVVNEQLSGILGIWRNLWEDSADLARHAKGFIEHGIKSAKEAHARSARVD